jgi:ABC-2 type transport system permease protein
MLKPLRSHLKLLRDYAGANMLMALEYRASFVTQVVGMVLNDSMWVIFWWIYFSTFQVLQGGWTLHDVLGLWAVTGMAFGLCMGLFGNTLRLAEIISQGKLDYYLVLPKNVLLHVLVSSMDVTAWGDMLFGAGLFIAFLQPTPERAALFIFMSLCGAAVFLAFNIGWQSLAFWLGNAEGLAFQLWGALIAFSTYPPSLFRGAVKLMLFTVVPAAFLSHVPVEMLRKLDPAWLVGEVAFAVGTLALSIWVFYRGLRRYESGSLMSARS